MIRIKKSLVNISLTLFIGLFSIANAKTFVYVSNADDGTISSYEMDLKNGDLIPLELTTAGKLVMPMTISPNKKHLYAVVRSVPLSIVTYGIDPLSGKLTKQGTTPLPDSMAYISIDKTGKYLFTASYGGNKIAVNPINSMGIAEGNSIQVIPTGENAHSIRPDLTNKFVYATNLGSNQILQFKFNQQTGRLTPNSPSLIKAQSNNGPRHIAISPDNRFLYVVNELTGNVAQFRINTDGTLHEIGYFSSVPVNTKLLPGKPREALQSNATSGANTKVVGDDTPRIWAADIQITPNGRFMYVSERTDSKVSLMTIDQTTGRLKYIRSYPTEIQPRGIRIDPTGNYLIVSGEKSDRIAVYKIDQNNGLLDLSGRYPVGKDANWVEIVNF